MARQLKQSDDPALEQLRAKIDEIDRQIQALISDRARVAKEVGEIKGLTKKAEFYRPEREARVLRAVAERNEGPLTNEEMLRLFREIMSACLAQEEPLKIAYLGPEGTFTQSAVYTQFGHSVRALSVPTIYSTPPVSPTPLSTAVVVAVSTGNPELLAVAVTA